MTASQTLKNKKSRSFLKKKMKKDFPYDVINDKFYSMESTSDFIQLLNEVKDKFLMHSSEKIIEQNVDLKPITINRIKFYLSNLKKGNGDTENNLYQINKIPKKTGGTRVIHAPNADLKIVLKCIDILLRSVYIPHPNAFAFIESKNIVDNAKMHTNKRFVYNIDLKDFFYSFDYNRVKMALYKTPFNLNTSKEKEEIAYWISILTTCKINGKQVLPQGSPASPVLTNIICTRFDDKLYRLSREFSLNYSRYADDITFSSDQQVFHGKFLRRLNGIIESEGFLINDSKVRLQNQGERQVVTGITVNKGTNVSHEYIKELRMYLYYIEQYGIKKAFGYFLNDKRKKQVNDYSSLDTINETYFQKTLKGKLNFLSMVKGKSDPVYSKLSNRYNELFPNQKTSFMEHIALICGIASINTARKIYDEKNKKRNHKILSSFNINEIEYVDVIDLNDEASVKGQEKKRALIDQMNQSQPKEKKEPTELQLNINFLRQILAEDSISILERHFIFEAFSKYVNTINETAVKSNNVSKFKHDPKKLVELLNYFGSDQGTFKFTTHLWDGEEIGSYESFTRKIYERFKSLIEMQYLDNDLWWQKIHPFVFQDKPNPKGNPFYWGIHKIKIGWKYPDYIKEWCSDNYDNKGQKAIQPFSIVIPDELLPDDRIINKVTIKTFMDVVNLFKKEIEFRSKDFYISIQYLISIELSGFSVDSNALRTLKSFCIYANTEKILAAIKTIFKLIKSIEKEREENGIEANKSIQIRTEFHDTDDEKFYTMEILHVNSFCQKPYTHPKLSGKKGDLAKVIKDLKGRCDFSVISMFGEENKRVFAKLDYLYPGCTDLNYDVITTTNVIEPGGFVYWFKFYV